MHKKILITAGGTGGHIFPAQGFAQQLKKVESSSDILFVAGGLNSNRYFVKSLFPFHEVPCSPLISKNPLKVIKGLVNLFKGVYRSLQIIKEYKPTAVVAFGSYYTLPVLLAAKLSRIPIVLHEANSIPGKANKWFAPYAYCVGVHFPLTSGLLKGNVVEVGMPMRDGYTYDALSKKDSLSYFQLQSDKQTLLIFGGSQGAKAINQLIKASINSAWNRSLQIIHLTGDESCTQEFQSLYKNHGITACVKAFEKEMNRAWKAADLFIGRAGAATVAEAMEFEVPGILIPFPYATENHQEFNADFLTKTVGGGVKYLEKNLTPEKLHEVLLKMTQKEILDRMKLSMKGYKGNPSRTNLCNVVLRIKE